MLLQDQRWYLFFQFHTVLFVIMLAVATVATSCSPEAEIIRPLSNSTPSDFFCHF